MVNSYTSNVNLAKPATSDTGWGTPVNANADAIDAFAAIGGLAVALHEVPSASLTVKVSAGRYRKADGTLATYAGTASQALTLSATNYIFLLDSTGVLTVNTTGWPATFHVPLAIALCGASTITTLTDARVPLVSSGALLSTLFVTLAAADSGGVVIVNTGSSNGTRIGGTTADKLGFWGAVPVVQPSGANQAAITDGSGGTAGFAIAAIADAPTADAVASLARQVAAIRSALVSAGILKGSA